MPARINYVHSQEEARQRLEDEEASALGTLSEAMERTIRELAARLPRSTTIHVARDWEGCCFALVEDEQDCYPLGEAFALGERGGIGRGGVNQPIYYDTLDELLAADPAE